jgi:hypothetical protein
VPAMREGNVDVDPGAVLVWDVVEGDSAILEGVEGVIPPHPHVLPAVELGPSLSHQDVPALHLLSYFISM